MRMFSFVGDILKKVFSKNRNGFLLRTALLVLSFQFSGIAIAQIKKSDSEQVPVQKSGGDQRLEAAFMPIYYRFALEGFTFSGTGISAGVDNAINNWFGFGFAATQGYTSQNQATSSQATDTQKGLSGLFLDFDLHLRFAITGSLMRPRTVTNINSYTLVDTQAASTGGLRADLGLSQMLLNTVNTAVPYSGVSFGVSYELPTKNSFSYGIGCGIQRLNNPETAFAIFQAFLKLTYWI